LTELESEEWQSDPNLYCKTGLTFCTKLHDSNTKRF
jgi:hypothetical protein